MTVDVASKTQVPRQDSLRIFGILLFTSVFASISTISYGLAIAHQVIALPKILLMASALSAVVTTPLASLGLWSRSQQSIEDSSLAALLIKEKWIFSLFLAIGLGSWCGFFVTLSDQAFYSALPIEIREVALPGPLPGLLAAFGAGINEEIWFRLGVLTGLVGIGRWALKQSQTSRVLFWTANGVAALLFGTAHLPQFALIASELPLTFIGVVLFQNSIAGVIFGWLYWRRGLLAAMVAHVTADIVIYVIVPVFTR